MKDIRRIDVQASPSGYTVTVGTGVRHLLGSLIDNLHPAKVLIASALPDFEVPALSVPFSIVPVVDGEPAKTLQNVESLVRAFARAGMTRNDVVVSCGGGTVTDIVGLSAALYHRGIPVIHLPTTLLAQADASIGGKTGVNLPEGKNLIGAYWHPAGVLCDIDFLTTLPSAEWRSGFGEIARCELVTRQRLRGLPLTEQIAVAVRLKAEVVATDERDHGARLLLNYGHTLGHALETATEYRMRHGEAVAVGMTFAAVLARKMGRISDSRVAEHSDVMRAYGLPEKLPSAVGVGQLLQLMTRDKKASEGLTFILDGPHGMEVVRDVPSELASGVLQQLGAGPG